MKLVSINIETNKHTKSVLEFIKKEDPDVVCMQEILEKDFDFYKKELNLSGVFESWHMIDHHVNQELIGEKDGIAIFAKNIVDSESFFCTGSKDNILKPFSEYISNDDFRKNNAILCINTKDANGALYKFITTHLPVTKDGESTPYQLQVADSILKKLETIEDFIICGDFNAPRGNETFSHFEKKYKDNIPLKYKASLDQNLHRVKGLQLMVDCLFSTPSYNITDVRFADGISDHMAIVAEIDKTKI